MASPRQQSSIAGEGYGLSQPIWISLWADADLDSCFPLGCQMQSSMTDEWMSDSVQQRDPRMAGGGGWCALCLSPSVYNQGSTHSSTKDFHPARRGAG